VTTVTPGSAAVGETENVTSPPCERVITDGIRRAVLAEEGITRVDPHVVWDPARHAGMIAANAFLA